MRAAHLIAVESEIVLGAFGKRRDELLDVDGNAPSTEQRGTIVDADPNLSSS